MTQTPEPQQPWWQKKKKLAVSLLVAIVVGTPLGLALTLSEQDARAETQKPTEKVQEPPQKPAEVCRSGAGQKIEQKMLDLCDVVAAQHAYETKTAKTPPGTQIVVACRTKAREQSVEAGDARVGAKFVVSCLIAEHEAWWDWQAMLTLPKKPQKA